jgi:hypothetical protein
VAVITSSVPIGVGSQPNPRQRGVPLRVRV